jgi:excisionase family DNA binding protein
MTAKSLCENAHVKHLRDYPDILTVQDVSEILGVSTKTIYKLIKQGQIKKRSVGRAFKIPKVNILTYLGIDEVREIR